MKSNFLSLNLRDAVNGFVVAFFSTALVSIVEILDSGNLPQIEELKTAAMVGLTAGVSYLLKNLFSNAAGDLFKKDV